MNFKNEIEKIKPINISAAEFNKHEIPYNVRKSIVLYNKSIANLKTNHADLAIVDLKKSLDLNPGFCEAIKLLGLSYVCEKDFHKAEDVFKKLSKYNIYSILADDYLNELNVERTTSKALDAIRSFSSNSNNSIESDDTLKVPRYRRRRIKKTSTFPKKFAVLFLVLTIIIAISGLAYWKGLNIQTTSNKVENPEIKKNKELEQEKIMNEKYTKMNEEKKKLEKSLENTKLQLDNYKNKNDVILKLNDAEKFYQEGNYEKTVDNLVVLKTLVLDDTEKSRVNRLWNDIKTNAIWDIYRLGNSLYKQGNYQEALPKLIKVQQLEPELEIAPWVLYQIANCYKETNDSKNALIFFEKVKNSYPNSEYAGYSEGMISEINSKIN